MLYVQRVGFVLVLLLSLWRVISSLIAGDYWGALAWLVGGAAIEIGILGISSPWDDSGLYKTLAAVAGACALFSVMATSPATNFERQTTQLDLFQFYLDVLGGTYISSSPEVHRIASIGLTLCATQHIFDATDFLLKLKNAETLGPGASLTMDSYEQLVGNSSKPLGCLDTFVAFRHADPELAKAFLTGHPKLASVPKGDKFHTPNGQ